ncbi:MAG: preprotein translocase subunit SecA [Candidatus Methylacidiphilales bacterium]
MSPFFSSLTSLLPFSASSKLRSLIAGIQRMEPQVLSMSQESMRDMWNTCATQARRDGKANTTTTTHAFALLREASRRATGLRPYDVQIYGALCMGRRLVAEMATGEGKTLVAGLAAAFLSLGGKGVHVATVNRYLAERDAEIIRPILDFFGISLGVLKEKDNNDQKRAAYLAEITYGTGYEFGFDYLRDQLKLLDQGSLSLGEKLSTDLMGKRGQKGDYVQRVVHHAVVDEIDSVLIDEAITPLIISPALGSENPGAPAYRQANELAKALKKDVDYEVDDQKRNVTLLPAGLEKIYSPEFHPRNPEVLTRAWHFYLEQALRAQECFILNGHYLVRKDKVEIIDENTGRGFADRKWREGLHQAVEAKENATISPEMQSQVSISRQTFFQRYPHLCGMTGTARESAAELDDIYGLGVEPVPRHKPSQLRRLPDRIFRSWEEKMTAYIAEIKKRHALGQPILAGTRSVQRSEELAERLAALGIEACVINARLDEQEAELIARAGEVGRITIATNMVGRGTDIKLRPGAEEVGGLMVLGEERYDSPRLDRQLSGRAGRQGEPGGAQFFLSADDYLFNTFGVKEGEQIRKARASKEGEVSPGFVRLAFRVQNRTELEQRYQRKLMMLQDERFHKLKRHFKHSS